MCYSRLQVKIFREILPRIMDKGPELTGYIQDLYSYYAIAAAVAVVLFKPKDQTIEYYLRTLRDSLTAKEVSENQVCVSTCNSQDASLDVCSNDSAYGSQDVAYYKSKGNHEHSIKFTQQEVTVSQIQTSSQSVKSTANVSKVSDTVYDSDTDFIDELIANLDLSGNIHPNSGEENVVESNDGQLNVQNVRNTAVENATFIYAIIGLRFAAKQETFISASTVSQYLSATTADVARHLKTSLLGDTETGSVVNNNIASAFIQYHTLHVHEHVLQSVDRAVSALGTLILDKRPEVVCENFNSWENSVEHYVVDNICSALDFLCDGGGSTEYTTSCVQLIKSFLEIVMKTDSEDKFVMWEQQCGMLLKLVGHRHVCGQVVGLLVENIQELAANVKLNSTLTTEEQVKKLHRFTSIQVRSFYIFNLTEDLLLEYKKIHCDIVKNCGGVEGSQEVQQIVRTDELWKNAFSCDNDDNLELRNSQQLICTWKSSLIQSAMTFTNCNAHLLSIYAWSCVDLVKDLQQ